MTSTGVALDIPTVVYVHGAGNKPPQDDLKRLWDQDLFGTDMGERTQMTHYADLLHDRPGLIGPDACDQEQMLTALVSGALTVAPAEAPAGDESGRGADVADQDAAEDAELLDRLTPDGRQLALSLSLSIAARAASGPAAGGPLVGGQEVAALLPVPAPLRRLLLRQLLRRLIPDADAYFFTGKQEPIRARLRRTLDAVAGPAVVISHSLGTVIAYDVLSEPRFAGRPTPLLITLGSPLGYTEIQDVVTKPLRVPPQVRLWANFADPFDVITLDTTLADDFRNVPRVIVDTRVDNHSPNNHAVCGYLHTSQVRATVAAALPR